VNAPGTSIKAVDILLVEDNATDAELGIRALKKHNLANNVVWVKDGAEGLDFVFRTGVYEQLHRQARGVRPIRRDHRQTGSVLAGHQPGAMSL
jgi:hypothetical protein